ncbi:aminotransferase class V-fold PLP-dependent enzyme [Novosphingobium pokkalii]|uniref:Aminotransferase class V-fold PLP-dependent enzyme n=2 Tax=Novosphingobium pokkalii TaxID=1770194 RepID=A0ABV7V3G7_9SPHN|nr:aminotransferase class V-fold PLP-dependent enzyme [Novosphingobium pokkalii]
MAYRQGKEAMAETGLTRRQAIHGLGAGVAAGMAVGPHAMAAPAPIATVLPARAAFAPTSLAYLDNGSQHPLSLGGQAAIEAYLAKRRLDPAAQGYELDEEGLLAKFARLINAEPDEVTYVQSTTAAEQMVLRALELPGNGGARVVTDTLHFFGSIPLYEEMARQGVNVTWVRAVDGRIRLEDMAKALEEGNGAGGARLVALSQVSTINGFEHDLKAVCDLAHAHGALVYADMIHAAGCVPVDVKASGVDFAACASYKWLMGDFGLGFLYVRRDVWPRLKRCAYGYYGIDAFQPHIYPLDPPGEGVADYAFADNATGRFALGTHSHAVIAQLHHSLDWIMAAGVARIQAHAQALVARLKAELPARGYAVMTPPECRAPIVTAICADARARIGPAMAAAGVKLTLSANRFRLTPSVQNDDTDIDRFLAALPRA